MMVTEKTRVKISIGDPAKFPKRSLVWRQNETAHFSDESDPSEKFSTPGT